MSIGIGLAIHKATSVSNLYPIIIRESPFVTAKEPFLTIRESSQQHNKGISRTSPFVHNVISSLLLPVFRHTCESFKLQRKESQFFKSQQTTKELRMEMNKISYKR